MTVRVGWDRHVGGGMLGPLQHLHLASDWGSWWGQFRIRRQLSFLSERGSGVVCVGRGWSGFFRGTARWGWLSRKRFMVRGGLWWCAGGEVATSAVCRLGPGTGGVG